MKIIFLKNIEEKIKNLINILNLLFLIL